MSLVETNKDSALDFINSFSNMCRYILENSDNISTAIDIELNFVKDYLAIYKANYGYNAIKFNINVPSKYLKYELPKLSIQMLVENALKHNFFSEKKPLCIEIYLNNENTYLCVGNNIQLKKKKYSTHIGLKNINDRYKKMGDLQIEIEKNDEFFSVQLQLIKPEI